MRRRVRGAASLCFVLEAQARKLSLSGWWAEGALKGHVRNSDDDAAIEFLSVSSVSWGRSVGSRADCPIE